MEQGADMEQAGQHGADGGQYVTFHVEDGLFAVPLAEVREIIRMPDVVGVPLSPRCLEGIANLRGTVMAITNLRRIFEMPDAAHDDATRVVVIDRGTPVGLVVDRMAAVVSAAGNEVEPVADLDGTISAELMSGMIKSTDQRPMIVILDIPRLIDSGYGRPAIQAAPALLEQEAEDVLPVRRTAADDVQLVSFEVAGEEYALGIESVQEIVQLPARINRVPRSDPHVLGVVTLRNRLLPLVSLREMFGLPRVAHDDRNKIVVVPFESGRSVGIVMDMVKEVLSVSRELVDPVPPWLVRREDDGDIAGICRLDEGRRLVSILSAERLFDHDLIRRAADATAEETDMDEPGAGAGIADAIDDEEQFVVFRLGNEEYGVPIAGTQEIVRVPDALTRMPKAPSFIEGVVNLRGAVLPVIDQRQRFGLPTLARNDRQRIMVFLIGGVRTGFIVDSVSEVLKIPARNIGPAPALAVERARLIGRVANLDDRKRMILLVEIDRLLEGHELAEVHENGGGTLH
jgi:purine-binding chemotaxis protein CheW